MNIVNNDELADKFMKVVYVPNYGVSVCEKFVSACDLSQHISTPGTEVKTLIILLNIAKWNFKYEVYYEWWFDCWKQRWC